MRRRRWWWWGGGGGAGMEDVAVAAASLLRRRRLGFSPPRRAHADRRRGRGPDRGRGGGGHGRWDRAAGQDGVGGGGRCGGTGEGGGRGGGVGGGEPVLGDQRLQQRGQRGLRGGWPGILRGGGGWRRRYGVRGFGGVGGHGRGRGTRRGRGEERLRRRVRAPVGAQVDLWPPARNGGRRRRRVQILRHPAMDAHRQLRRRRPRPHVVPPPSTLLRCLRRPRWRAGKGRH